MRNAWVPLFFDILNERNTMGIIGKYASYAIVAGASLVLGERWLEYKILRAIEKEYQTFRDDIKEEIVDIFDEATEDYKREKMKQWSDNYTHYYRYDAHNYRDIPWVSLRLRWVEKKGLSDFPASLE